MVAYRSWMGWPNVDVDEVGLVPKISFFSECLLLGSSGHECHFEYGRGGGGGGGGGAGGGGGGWGVEGGGRGGRFPGSLESDVCAV